MRYGEDRPRRTSMPRVGVPIAALQYSKPSSIGLCDKNVEKKRVFFSTVSCYNGIVTTLFGALLVGVAIETLCLTGGGFLF